jgi:spermidine synthase
VRQRLAPGGIFVQWLQAYEIDATTMKSAYATLASAFPAVETWQTNSGDLLLIGTEAPLAYDADRMRARLTQEPFRKAALVAWSTDELEGVLAHYVGGDALARKVAEGQESLINTDDLSFMEFAIARTVGRTESAKLPIFLRAGAQALQAARPPVSRGSVDWERVETQRVVVATATHQNLLTLPLEVPRAAAGRQQFTEMVSRGDAQGAVRKWREGGWQPQGLVELTLVARALAQSGDEAAVPFLDQLRPIAPMEADTLLGVLRLRQGRMTEAALALEKAFVTLHRDPWGQRTVTPLLMEATQVLAQRDHALGMRLYAQLEQPFAGHALQTLREKTRLAMARVLDWHGLCQKALQAYEPHPLWEGDFLVSRYECYDATKDPLREQAETALKDFLAAEPPALFDRDVSRSGAPAQDEPDTSPSVSQDNAP